MNKAALQAVETPLLPVTITTQHPVTTTETEVPMPLQRDRAQTVRAGITNIITPANMNNHPQENGNILRYFWKFIWQSFIDRVSYFHQ